MKFLKFILNIFRIIGIFNTLFLMLKGKNNKVILGDKLKLSECFIRVTGENNIIEILEEGNIQKSIIEIIGNNSTIRIGKKFWVQEMKIWCKGTDGNIKIGNNCMFSNNIEIRNTDSHPIYDLETDERINLEKDVEIKDKVWIGSGVRILKGVTIEEGNVIGQNSFLTKSILEKNCVIVENGRIIRKRIRWEM